MWIKKGCYTVTDLEEEDNDSLQIMSQNPQARS